MRTTLGVAIVVVLVMPSLLANQTKPPATDVASTATNQIKTASGLIYEIVVKGTGAMAQRGDKVRIHESLSLPDGRSFSTAGRRTKR
jgi:FKBP-type peptidyl-prolyl cis-trans isomerase